MSTPDRFPDTPDRQQPPVGAKEREVERRFFVDVARMPEMEFAVTELYDQGYVAIGAQRSELRVRRVVSEDGTVTYTMNMKVGKGLVRFEPLNEVEIPEDLFVVLWDKSQPDILQKQRRSTHFGSHMISVDTYLDEANAGLVTADVEFYGDTLEERLAAAAAFEVPDWFGEEITERPEFNNQSLATKRRGEMSSRAIAQTLDPEA